MKYVIIEKSPGYYDKLELDEFIKQYGITPKHTGEYFYLLREEGRDIVTHKFPNPACIFIEGQIKYIIYKGNSTTIINGVRMPNAEFVSENQVLGSQEEINEFINKLNETDRGKVVCITYPDGRIINI